MKKCIVYLLIVSLTSCEKDLPMQLEKATNTALRTDSTEAESDSLLAVIDQYILEKSNPWIEFTPEYKATESSQELDYNFTLFIENSLYGSFVLTNVDPAAHNIVFEVDNKSSNVITLFEVKQVKTNTGKAYSDPIVPIIESVILPINESKLFIFQIKGKQVGRSNLSISIDNGRQKKSVSINAKVMVPNEITEDLNAVNWSYFERPVLENRKIEAGNDLYDHHINTTTVLLNSFPGIEATDFSNIVNYVSYIKNVKNVLILQFPNYNNKTHPFLSEQWKKLFVTWYTNMLNALSNAGYSKEHIYFSPYDEIKINSIPQLEQLYSWAKIAIPKFKLYSTIDNEESANKVIPMADITQLIHLHVPKLIETNYPEKKELWMYDTFGPTYTLSPYTYYRLMAWIAYYRDIKGIGFWAYADKGKPMNEVVDATEENYSIIYTEGAKIISSRRWEAFSLGIEDHRILKLYEKKFGKEKTKAMVWDVISAKDKYDLAEQVRMEMINAL